MENILSQLNESQREAVCYNDGPALVIAGAGSGKTRVLTYKIAYLLKQGMNPWNILALTFTNKAAREMQQRVGRLVGEATAARLNMGTFHSVFSHILRVEASSIGYNSQFTIYDETDSRSLLKQIIKSFSLDDKIYKPATVHNRISMAKNNLETASDYKLIKTYQERDRDSKMPAIGAIYEAYDQRLRQANAMDFDDLLMNTYILFRENDDIRRKYAERFQFVLVDEYQDTNYAQQAIVLQLVENHHRLCVVGDDAQSIYAFRGANIDNILDFQKRFPESRLFKLEQNYRSTQRIVEAANSLIKHNKRQIHKDVYSHNDEGEKIVYEAAYSDKEEAIIVSKYIQKIRRQDNCDYSDFAILYRTNAQSRSFEEQLRKDSIPYRIYGGLSFYQRKEIKDVIAYFRLAVNHDDEEAFRRIINYPARGIGNTTVQKIIDCAQQDRVSLWEVVANPLLHGLNISKSTINRLTQFINLISSYTSMLTEKDAYELGLYIVTSSGIAAEVGSSTNPEDLARKENLDEFISGMQEFAETAREEDRQQEAYLPNFLQEVALLTDLDSKDDATSRVSLMTVHAAKGLEFPTVFIVGMEENIFPNQMAQSSSRELEEERRLFYVALTRAEKHCIITNAQSRFRYGRMEFDAPSRFIEEIDPSLLSLGSASGKSTSPWNSSKGRSSFTEYSPNPAYGGSSQWGREQTSYGHRMQNSRPVASQFMADPQQKITSPRQPEAAVDPLSSRTRNLIAASGGNLRRIDSAISNGGRTVNHSQTDSNSSSLRVGNVIEHQRFGIGTVLAVEGTGDNTKATVEFRNAGTKQLLLKFARFSILK